MKLGFYERIWKVLMMLLVYAVLWLFYFFLGINVAGGLIESLGFSGLYGFDIFLIFGVLVPVYFLARGLTYQTIRFMGYHAEPQMGKTPGLTRNIYYPRFIRTTEDYKASYQQRSRFFSAFYQVLFAGILTLGMILAFSVSAYTYVHFGQTSAFFSVMSSIFVFFILSYYLKDWLTQIFLNLFDLKIHLIEHDQPIFIKK